MRYGDRHVGVFFTNDNPAWGPPGGIVEARYLATFGRVCDTATCCLSEHGQLVGLEPGPVSSPPFGGQGWGFDGTPGSDLAGVCETWGDIGQWDRLDQSMVNMAGCSQRVLNLFWAPLWMLGQSDSTPPSTIPGYTDSIRWYNQQQSSLSIMDSWVAAYADLAHYCTLRYTGRVPSVSGPRVGGELVDHSAHFASHPVTHMAVWSEMKGYFDPAATSPEVWPAHSGWNRLDRYLSVYNAIWDRIKATPETAAINVGGPYISLRPGLKSAAALDYGTDIIGDWGFVDQRDTSAYLAFAGLSSLSVTSRGLTYRVPAAHGIDFLVADYGWNLTSYTAAVNRDSVQFSASRIHDISAWLKQTICSAHGGIPLLVQELYWSGGSSWSPMLLDACFSGGADTVSFWHASRTTAMLIADQDGNPADGYYPLLDYRWPKPAPRPEFPQARRQQTEPESLPQSEP